MAWGTRPPRQLKGRLFHGPSRPPQPLPGPGDSGTPGPPPTRAEPTPSKKDVYHSQDHVLPVRQSLYHSGPTMTVTRPPSVSETSRKSLTTRNSRLGWPYLRDVLTLKPETSYKILRPSPPLGSPRTRVPGSVRHRTLPTLRGDRGVGNTTGRHPPEGSFADEVREGGFGTEQDHGFRGRNLVIPFTGVVGGEMGGRPRDRTILHRRVLLRSGEDGPRRREV